MRDFNLDNVEIMDGSTTSSFNVPAGGYLIKITSVEDIEEKEYLKFTYDIYFGEHKGFFANSKYPPQFIKSYKETALGFFKGFVTAVENTNTKTNYKFNQYKLQELVGKIVGAVIGLEEYQAKDGRVFERNTVTQFISGQKITDGEFTVPAVKKLQTIVPPVTTDFVDITDDDTDDLPFE